MAEAAAAPTPAAAPAAVAPAAAAPASAPAPAAAVAAPVADAKAAAAPVFADTPPNPTLYVHNINEKIKLAELKKSLYHVFNQFGNILEVQAKKTYKMRGQAWIVFEDLSGATKGLKDMNNFNFYGKPLKVSFAKAKSDVIAKADGSYVARPKRKPDLKDKKKRKDGESKKRKTEDDADDDEKKPAEKKRKTEASNGNGANGGGDGSVPASHAAAYSALQATMESTPPNRILFVENLPPDAIQTMLAMLFQQYPGYQEARMVPGKPGIAFVEFVDAYTAGNAMNALQNFKITATHLMKISYARQ